VALLHLTRPTGPEPRNPSSHMAMPLSTRCWTTALVDLSDGDDRIGEAAGIPCLQAGDENGIPTSQFPPYRLAALIGFPEGCPTGVPPKRKKGYVAIEPGNETIYPLLLQQARFAVVPTCPMIGGHG
jgi:hypothetical protein